MSILIIYLINVYVREVLTLFDIVSQRLVHGFWALIPLRNQISNWNHVTGRTDPQPVELISRYFVFLFRLTFLLCLFIYLSIYPYLSLTLHDHHRPAERVWIRLHTYIGCDATLATPPSRQQRLFYPHEESASLTLFNFGFLLANKRPWGFGLSWYLLVRVEVKYVPFVPPGPGITERNSNVVPFPQSFNECPWKWRNLRVAVPRWRARRAADCVRKCVLATGQLFRRS